jgi:hypothetical protein
MRFRGGWMDGWMDEREQSMCKTIASIDVSELKLESDIIFKKIEALLKARGKHFRHLL